MPHLNELYEQYKDEGLVVLGVCTSTQQENYEQVVKETRMQYPVARDPDQKTLKGGEWVVEWFPTYVIVDKSGKVRASGLFNDDGTEQIIRTLLAEEYTPEEEDDDDSGKKDDDADKDDDDDDGGDAEPFVEVPSAFFERPNADKLALVGKQAPELQTTEWMNGEPTTLEALRGKVVLLDYWATW